MKKALQLPAKGTGLIVNCRRETTLVTAALQWSPKQKHPLTLGAEVRTGVSFKKGGLDRFEPEKHKLVVLCFEMEKHSNLLLDSGGIIVLANLEDHEQAAHIVILAAEKGKDGWLELTDELRRIFKVIRLDSTPRLENQHQVGVKEWEIDREGQVDEPVDALVDLSSETPVFVPFDVPCVDLYGQENPLMYFSPGVKKTMLTKGMKTFALRFSGFVDVDSFLTEDHVQLVASNVDPPMGQTDEIIVTADPIADGVDQLAFSIDGFADGLSYTILLNCVSMEVSCEVQPAADYNELCG